MKVKTPEPKPSKSDNKRVQPRNRIKYTAGQLRQLECVFMSSQYPDSCTLEELSNTLSINTERLSIWFQNRRSKFKRQAKGSHVNWMRQQLYHQGSQSSRDINNQSDKCHVLSPPVNNNAVPEAPKSNLNYYGMNYPAAVPGCDPSYFTTSPMFHQMTTSYPSSSERISASDYTHSPLLLPHMNEISYPQMVSFPQQNPSYPQQSPSYPQQSPTYTSPSTSPSEHDHSYLPSYTFPGTQLAFTPIA
ncbi:homeobox protein prophet of Pit-1-like [Haliotis cracherodii]|uniref:homeobox protein prophet of Pit-1-like n=1 Tax=Haliotis cracherodii TaxID=6455 RepID=UPI0039ED77E8